MSPRIATGGLTAFMTRLTIVASPEATDRTLSRLLAKGPILIQTSIWTVLDVYAPERALLIETLSDLGGSQWALPAECPAHDVKGIASVIEVFDTFNGRFGEVALDDNAEAADIFTRGLTADEIHTLVTGPTGAVSQLRLVAGRP